MLDDFAATFEAQRPIWLARLARCERPNDVLDVVHEFVRVHRDVWASLPTDCQPPPFTVADDVSRYALSLCQRDLGSDPRRAAYIHALASFYSQASHRMATVMATNTGRFLRSAFFDGQS
jgi:hypothetical protein